LLIVSVLAGFRSGFELAFSFPLSLSSFRLLFSLSSLAVPVSGQDAYVEKRFSLLAGQKLAFSYIWVRCLRLFFLSFLLPQTSSDFPLMLLFLSISV
jgi:hypothetical protein